jgi:hypothetical protein
MLPTHVDIQPIDFQLNETVDENYQNAIFKFSHDGRLEVVVDVS